MEAQTEIKTLTAEEIIKESVEYYTADHSRYAYDNGCEYLTAKGQMCGVGRCLIEPGNFPKAMVFDAVIENDPDYPGRQSHVLTHVSTWLDSKLKPQYRGQTLLFWCRMQDAHDMERFGSPNYMKSLTAEISNQWI